MTTAHHLIGDPLASAGGSLPSPATSTANASTDCGHLTTWGTSWASTSCTYTLTSAPSQCPSF
jgi:hypothetical protein